MIKYTPHPTLQCKLYFQKYTCKAASLICGITTLVIGIVLAIIGIIWHWVIMIWILCPITMTIFASIPRLNSPLKILNLYFPKEIILYDSYLEIFSEKNVSMRYYSDVKRVVDCGKWYHIIFYFPNKNSYFIGQKDLIVNGTIQEFEEMFTGKIIRKTQK